jgi:hypothetical protein
LCRANLRTTNRNTKETLHLRAALKAQRKLRFMTAIDDRSRPR